MIGSDAWGADVRHLDAAGCPVRHSSSGPPPTRGPPTRPHLGPLHTPRRCGRGPPRLAGLDGPARQGRRARRPPPAV